MRIAHKLIEETSARLALEQFRANASPGIAKKVESFATELTVSESIELLAHMIFSANSSANSALIAIMTVLEKERTLSMGEKEQ